MFRVLVLIHHERCLLRQFGKSCQFLEISSSFFRQDVLKIIIFHLFTSVSVEVNIYIYCLAPIWWFISDNEIDRKIDVTAILFLLVQNRQQAHEWTLIGWGANGLGIQLCVKFLIPRKDMNTHQNSKFLFYKSLQLDLVDFWYFKLNILKEKFVKFDKSKVYTIRLQIYMYYRTIVFNLKNLFTLKTLQVFVNSYYFDTL